MLFDKVCVCVWGGGGWVDVAYMRKVAKTFSPSQPARTVEADVSGYFPQCIKFLSTPHPSLTDNGPYTSHFVMNRIIGIAEFLVSL